jgi:hypothetical protein
MNYDLMMAVLAMDAYGAHAVGHTVGFAEISLVAPKEYGFVAYAYNYKGSTVIAYRGTNTDSISGLVGDILYGWGQGLGFAPTQAELAAEFYKSVAGAGFPYSTNVTFTGHSLGGGLAGLMAGLYGQSAIGFDSMAYHLAESLPCRPVHATLH